jgi:SAM-dependent methyltransferase
MPPIGVLIHTGAPGRALKEIHRVLRPGGRAIMCHFYRRPSLFHALSRLGGVDVVASGKNAPPLIDFFSEAELRDLFAGYRIERLDREHLRLIPGIRRGVKGALYNYGVCPLYNLLPAALRGRYANKDVGGGDQAKLAGHDEPGRSTRACTPPWSRNVTIQMSPVAPSGQSR